MPVAYIFLEPMFLLLYFWKIWVSLGGFPRWEMASRSYVFLCLPCSVGPFKPMNGLAFWHLFIFSYQRYYFWLG